MTAASETISLLEKKRDILLEILHLTENEKFTGEPDKLEREAEHFAFLYSKRDKLVSDLAKVDAMIDNADLMAVLESDDFSKKSAAEALTSENKSLLRQILELDSRNKPAGEALLEGIRSNIKHLNQNRRVNQKYNADLGETDGFIVDEMS